jgi:hypothetical protein
VLQWQSFGCDFAENVCVIFCSSYKLLAMILLKIQGVIFYTSYTVGWDLFFKQARCWWNGPCCVHELFTTWRMIYTPSRRLRNKKMSNWFDRRRSNKQLCTAFVQTIRTVLRLFSFFYGRSFYLTLSPAAVKTQCLSQCQTSQCLVRNSHTLVNWILNKFWSTESIFNQLGVFLKTLNALCVCLQNKYPRSIKKSH